MAGDLTRVVHRNIEALAPARVQADERRPSTDPLADVITGFTASETFGAPAFSQNRRARIAELDLQISLLAEHEIAPGGAAVAVAEHLGVQEGRAPDLAS